MTIIETINFLEKIYKSFILISLFSLLLWRHFKGIYPSKALTCMKIFLYKQELLFRQGDQYLWPHCYMNNLYISHRYFYARFIICLKKLKKYFFAFKLSDILVSMLINIQMRTIIVIFTSLYEHNKLQV